MKMNVFKLQGGLGNQLFIIAAVLHSISRDRVTHKIDTSLFDNPSEIRNFVGWDILRQLGLEDCELQKNSKSGDPLVIEKLKRFTENDVGLSQMSLPSHGAYIEGYFQNFEFYKDGIFDLSKRINSVINQNLANGILTETSPNTAHVHVRRGDYLSMPHILDHHCQVANYYIKALRYLNRMQPLDHIRIFTDDQNFCREELKDQLTKYFDGSIEVVSDDQENPWLEFLSLADAEQMVISNSSFSWWAAMVAYHCRGVKASKIVYPKKWYKRKEHHLHVDDWVELD